MANLKELHNEWKKAKADCKLAWEMMGKATADVSGVLTSGIKWAVMAFPTFKKDLGPSLDNLHGNKDMKKSKEKADAAVTQYKKDIKSLEDSRDKAPEAKKGSKLEQIYQLVDKDLKTLGTVLGKIETALKSVKVPAK